MKKIMNIIVCCILVTISIYYGFKNNINYNLCELNKPKCKKEDKCIIRVNSFWLCPSKYDTVCNCTKEQYKGQGIIEYYKEK